MFDIFIQVKVVYGIVATLSNYIFYLELPKLSGFYVFYNLSNTRM